MSIFPKQTDSLRCPQPGFTLVEVITVLFVVALGMVGVMALITQNIKSQDINSKTLVAYQLAQEGVEIVRGIRDSDWRQGVDWRTGLADGTYYTDYTDPTLKTAAGIPSGRLDQDEDGFYYASPNSPNPQLYSRLVSINTLTAPETGIVVNSSVYWNDRGGSHSYSLQTYLYDWK